MLTCLFQFLFHSQVKTIGGIGGGGGGVGVGGLRKPENVFLLFSELV